MSGHYRQSYIRAGVIGMLLLWTQTAHAHIQQSETAGFLSGLKHPVAGFDHILAMIAVGIWGAQLGAPAIWLLPVTFPLVMAVGGFLALIGVPLPAIEVGIGVSSIVLGIAVCMEARPRLMIAAVLVGMFGLFHGHAHGTELPPGESGVLYSIGFVVATGVLHGVGILLGEIRRLAYGQAGLRVAGGAIAVCGIMFTWQAFK